MLVYCGECWWSVRSVGGMCVIMFGESEAC